MKRTYIVALALTVLLGAGSYFIFCTTPAAPSVVSSTATASSAILPAPAPPAVPVRLVYPTLPTTEPMAASTTPAPDITLSAGGNSFTAYVPDGATVLDAMRILASTTDFAFTSKDFPGLGAFVESINGKANADGYYWILYLNGAESSVGISSATLRPGDTIEWKYEKSY